LQPSLLKKGLSFGKGPFFIRNAFRGFPVFLRLTAELPNRIRDETGFLHSQMRSNLKTENGFRDFFCNRKITLFSSRRRHRRVIGAAGAAGSAR
jgi:hypothetical protein